MGGVVRPLSFFLIIFATIIHKQIVLLTLKSRKDEKIICSYGNGADDTRRKCTNHHW